MKIRVYSDLHTEFAPFIIPSLPDDSNTILVLAGDINTINRLDELESFVTECSHRFRGVIFVAGNHEFYHGSLSTTIPLIKKRVEHLYNVFVLEDESVLIGGVMFIGAVLWTDFDRENPVAIQYATQAINDFNLIDIDDPAYPYGRGLTPYDIIKVHNDSREYIFKTAKDVKQNGKKVVIVVHHLPTYQSVAERFVGHPLNSAFASELGYRILDAAPDVVIHGHTHDSFDYFLGDTRIVCNPRGYIPNEPNFNFDPLKTIEV